MCLILIFVSVNSIQAADINATDSSINPIDNNSIQSDVNSHLNTSLDDSLNETIKNKTQLTSPTTSTY